MPRWPIPLLSITTSLGLVIAALSGLREPEPSPADLLDGLLIRPSLARFDEDPPAPGREFRPPAWIDPGLVLAPPDDGAAAGQVLSPPRRYLDGATVLN